MIVRHLVETDGLHNRFAIHQRSAAGAERQADPGIALVALAVFLGQEQPAAVTFAEIVGDIGEFDQLVGIDMRRIGKADDDVGTGAAVRRHRGLLVDVLPADEIDLDLDAHFCGEFRGIGAEHVFVGVHKPHRPQHAQARAFFDRKRWRRSVGGFDRRRRGLSRRAGRGQRRGGKTQAERIAPSDVVVHDLLRFLSRRYSPVTLGSG